MVQGPALTSIAAAENFLEMQILWQHPTRTIPKSLGVGFCGVSSASPPVDSEAPTIN